MKSPDIPLGFFDRDRFSPLTGEAFLLLECPGNPAPDPPPDCVVIGVDRSGSLPDVTEGSYDVLLTAAEDAPSPWVGFSDLDMALASLTQAISANPLAASVLVEVLRLQETLPFRGGLALESLAYSTLLRGGEFERWVAAQERRDSSLPHGPLISVERDGPLVSVRLEDSGNRNAISAPMRDALYEALVNVLEDPSRPDLLVTGAGKCFSAGGHLPEFGSAADVAAAHRIRSQRSLAYLLHLLEARARVVFHGACIGSGIEIFAAAESRSARADSWFRLPEISMGLIPGAGGTVTVARAIGRHRAAWMMLSSKRIDAERAVIWGLVDEIVA